MRMDELNTAFEFYDKDKSGELDLGEFRYALNELGIKPTDAEFMQLVYEIDDGSGKIDLEEFKQCAVRFATLVSSHYQVDVLVLLRLLASICRSVSGSWCQLSRWCRHG